MNNNLFTSGQATKENLVLLHGLFGNLSNWTSVRNYFKTDYNVWAPTLPLYNEVGSPGKLNKLVDFLKHYIESNQIHEPVLVGNSLGGHVALLYSLRFPSKVKKLVLAGSSGLYENTLGISFPRVRDYQYIKNKVLDVFYQKHLAKASLIRDVFETVQQRNKVLSLVTVARETKKNTLESDLPKIQIPTLLIWGLQDTVTPPLIGKQFYDLLPNAKLHYINYCGHAPMMEQPEIFNEFVAEFINN